MKSLIRMKPVSLAVAICLSPHLQAFAADESGVFTLGAIEVTEQFDSKGHVEIVTQEHIRSRGQTNAGEAIADVPGVSIQSGGRRAETRANIRGFDSRQITLNLDGIPIYIPYDGNIDLSRFLIADLSRIEISKSLGSLLEGPNNMGGSINLVTRRPDRATEVDANIGFEAGKNGVFKNAQNIQVGSRLNERFYLSGGIARVFSDDFPLSDDFEPTLNGGTIYQDEGDRLHSGSESTTGNLKIGFTPNSEDEYALSYYRTEGRKDSPPYAGSADSVRYWDWPQWDKESLYYVGHTQFGQGYVKTRLFYDHFENALNSYDDDTYSSVTKGYAFRSQYDDHSIGGSIEAGVQLDNHLVKTALHIKHDEHKERDLNKDNATVDQSWRTYRGHTYSLGLEDHIQLSPQADLTLGYRHDIYELTLTDDGDPANDPQGSQEKDNFQIKTSYDLGAHRLFAGISLKSRFPNMKDLFSYRLGQAIPNVNLQAEQAIHYEIGSKGVSGSLNYQANLFYSDIEDAIESVTVASTECGGTTCLQNQNVGKATSKGAELKLNYPLNEQWDASLNYAYLLRDLADKTLVPTYSPEHTARASLDWYPQSKWNFGIDWRYQSDSETNTDGSRPVVAFSLWDLRAHYDINKNFSTDVVLKNALDSNYEIAEGDPMPGRTLWANLHARF
ncbi:TonB-dependent receptor [Thiomicrorhabdus sp.]|uniref:TonB-dependent receptor plug domain-containing protein n=1 Tax=Thiomicrorhabdus sp. TaxID=2039724 RepID=UPI0029C8748D|nr:TonB-dependent receptor [Thiomicrorhabdus sp.]